MASIKGLLNPNPQESISEMNRAATEAQAPDVSTFDYLRASATNSLMGGTGFSIWSAARNNDIDTGNYTPKQLSEIYPDTPKDFWKSNTTGFNAERIYDLYKREQERGEMYSYLTDISDANKGLYYDTLGLGASIAGSLADPFNWLVGAGASKVVSRIAPMVAKSIPGVYKAIAANRFSNKITEEIAENLLADTVITSGLNEAFLNKYDNQDRSVKDVFMESLGTSIFIGGLRGALGGKVKNTVPPSGSGGFVDQVANSKYADIGSRQNTALNSPSVNNAVLNKAIKETAVDPQSVKPTYNSVAKEAFGYSGDIKFNQTAGTVFGVFDRETGNSDYLGDRYGDGFVFVDNANVAQGVIEVTGLENKARFDIASIDLTKKKLADIDGLKANDFPGMLDIFQSAFGPGVFKKLDDDSSVADLYAIGNRAKKIDGISGRDIVDVFNSANKILEDAGYDGIQYKDKISGNHVVYSVFDGKLGDTDLIRAGDVEVSPKGVSIEKANARMDEPVRLSSGEEIAVADDVINDPLYDNDPLFTAEYEKLSNANHLQELNTFIETQKKIDPKEIELKVKEIEDELKLSEQFQVNINKRLNLEVESLKKYYQDNNPDQLEEIAKAFEFCLRKNT